MVPAPPNRENENAVICTCCQASFTPAAGAEAARAAECHVCRRHAPAPGRARGLVLWFQARRGYGFVRLATGVKAFCHASQVRWPTDQRLHAGDLVEAECVAGPRGWEARAVVRLAARRTLARIAAGLNAAPASQAPPQGRNRRSGPML